MLALYTSWLPHKQIKVHRLAIRHHHHRMARQLVAVPAVRRHLFRELNTSSIRPRALGLPMRGVFSAESTTHKSRRSTVQTARLPLNKGVKAVEQLGADTLGLKRRRDGDEGHVPALEPGLDFLRVMLRDEDSVGRSHWFGEALPLVKNRGRYS